MRRMRRGRRKKKKKKKKKIAPACALSPNCVRTASTPFQNFLELGRGQEGARKEPGEARRSQQEPGRSQEGARRSQELVSDRDILNQRLNMSGSYRMIRHMLVL